MVYELNDDEITVFYPVETWHSGTKCATLHVTEAEIKKTFVSAVNQILSEKEELVANVGLMIAALCDNTKLEQRQTKLQNEMTVVAEMTERCVYENARVALDQEEYQSRYDGLVDRFQKLQEEHDTVTARIAGNMARKKTMEKFIGIIET